MIFLNLIMNEDRVYLHRSKYSLINLLINRNINSEDTRNTNRRGNEREISQKLIEIKTNSKFIDFNIQTELKNRFTKEKQMSLISLLEEIDSQVIFADKSEMVISNYLFWINNNNEVNKSQIEEFLIDIDLNRLSKLPKENFYLLETLIVSNLQGKAYLQFMTSLIKFGKFDINTIDIEVSLKEINNRLYRSHLFDEEKAIFEITEFMKDLRSISQVFKVIGDKINKNLNEIPHILQNPPSLIMERFIELKRSMSPVYLTHLSQLLKLYFDLIIEDNLLTVNQFNNDDLLNETLIVEGLLLDGAQFNMIENMVILNSKTLSRLQNFYIQSPKNIQSNIDFIIENAILFDGVFKNEKRFDSYLIDDTEEMYSLITTEIEAQKNFKHSPLSLILVHVAHKSKNYSLIAFLNENIKSFPLIAQSLITESMYDLIILHSNISETHGKLLSYQQTLTDKKVIINDNLFSSFKISSYSSDTSKFSKLLRTTVELPIKQLMYNRMCMFYSKYIKSMNGDIGLKSFQDSIMKYQISSLSAEKMIEVYNNSQDIGSIWELENRFAPKYFNFYSRYLNERTIERMKTKYLRNFSKQELPEGYERRHEILAQYFETKKDQEQILSDFIRREERISLPKLIMTPDMKKNLTEDFKYKFERRWISKRETDSLSDYYILNR